MLCTKHPALDYMRRVSTGVTGPESSHFSWSVNSQTASSSAAKRFSYFLAPVCVIPNMRASPSRAGLFAQGHVPSRWAVHDGLSGWGQVKRRSFGETKNYIHSNAFQNGEGQASASITDCADVVEESFAVIGGGFAGVACCYHLLVRCTQIFQKFLCSCHFTHPLGLFAKESMQSGLSTRNQSAMLACCFLVGRVLAGEASNQCLC